MMNVARAREVLLSPDTPWSAEVKRDLAQAYIDHTRAIALLNAQLDTLERECVGLHNSVRAMDDELARVKADLRYLCGVKS